MDLEESGWSVRVAEREDATDLAHFLSIIDDQPRSTGEVLARLDAVQGVETAFLARSAGRAGGFACLRVVPCFSTGRPAAELTELYVVRPSTGGEIERALIVQAEALAKQRGASHLTLLTGLRNSKAQALYRALGYQDYALMFRKYFKAKE